MHVFALPGPQFLLVYSAVVALGAMIVTALGFVAVLRIGPPEGASLELTPFEAAYLLEREKHVVNTALAHLVASGHLLAQGQRVGLGPSAHAPVHSTSAREQRLFAALMQRASLTGGAPLEAMHSTGKPLASYAETLARRKLLLNWQSARGYRAAALLVVVTVFGFGLVKLVLGLAGGRPVAFLAMMLVGVVGAGWVVCAAPVRARAARKALDLLKARHPRQPGGGSMAMLTALYGVSVVPMVAALVAQDARARRTDDSCTDCASCGGGGGGCGGCGGD